MHLQLLNTLNRIGKHCEEYLTPDGSTLLLLQHGGRVLGLFPRGSDENFYWTHPALTGAESAHDLYLSTGWHNSGGDRTWVSPELHIFFPHFPRIDLYSVPPQLDPGNYKIVHTERGILLVNRFKIAASPSRGEVELEIAKSWGPAPDPLRHQTLLKEGWAGVEFAGYEQRTSLRFLGQPVPTSAKVGLWNLIQFPNGGEILIPTYFRFEPKVYFGKVTADEAAVSDHLVRFRMRASGSKKIGIQAIAATGRIAYVYQARSRWSLIIRNFSVNPSGEYVDVPWGDDGLAGESGYAVQACCIDNELGQFSEIEYHAPSISLVGGHTECDDTSQVWAFRGSSEQILSVTKRLVTDEAQRLGSDD